MATIKKVEEKVPKLLEMCGRDFKIWFDTSGERHYWTVGYFGGGAINVNKALEVAKEYAELHNVPIESVVVDEISKSRSYKYFKVFYSSVKQNKVDGIEDFMCGEDIWARLTS